MKLKNSIFSLLLFFTLVPLCLFGILSIYGTNQKIDEMAERNLEAVSNNQIMNIENFCRDRKEEMTMIANYDLTQDAILYSLGRTDATVDRSYVDNLLRERKKYSTFVSRISILDKDFRVVGSSDDYEVSEISELKYLNKQFHTGDFCIGNSYERETDDGTKKLVPAYIGVYRDDELIGYISEELDTAYFDELRLNMDSLADSTFYLLDGNGAIITAGDTKQKSSIKTFVSSDSGRDSFQKAWDAIDHEANPTGKIQYRYQGMDYITYYSYVENTDWGIRITENLSAQRQSTTSYSTLVVLALIFLTIGMFITQNFVTSRLLSPIDVIMQTFTQIRTTQDYSLRIPVKTSDEIGELSDGINGLLDYIEQEDMQEKARQRQLQQLAECDPLTGIKNKKAIEQEILTTVQRATESGEQITLGFLDIDDFRDYNTNYGHQKGDSVIQFVANVLKSELKGAVGRNGGDEFVFCYTGTMDDTAIDTTAARVLEKLNTTYIDDGTNETMPVPCSIGIVTAQGGNLDYVNLIQKADEAMYLAKEAGKNTFHVTHSGI